MGKKAAKRRAAKAAIWKNRWPGEWVFGVPAMRVAPKEVSPPFVAGPAYEIPPKFRDKLLGA